LVLNLIKCSSCLIIFWGWRIGAEYRWIAEEKSRELDGRGMRREMEEELFQNIPELQIGRPLGQKEKLQSLSNSAVAKGMWFQDEARKRGGEEGYFSRSACLLLLTIECPFWEDWAF